VSAGSVSKTTSYAFDDHDRLTSVTDPLNRTTNFAYAVDRIIDKPISITDSAGRTTYFVYDKRLRLVQRTDANGAVTRYAYDQRSNLISVTDANGNLTSYSFDRNDRKIGEIRPSVAGSTSVARTQTFSYDGADHLLKETTLSVATGGANRAIVYQYDLFDRLIRKTVQREGNSTTVDDDSTFAYENQLDAALLNSAVNGIASISFTNDTSPPFSGTGFSVAASQSGNPLGLITGLFGITRDGTGEIASVSKDGTEIYHKTYDSAGRLLTATAGVTAGSFTSTLTWDGFGRKSSVVHSDGASGSFQLDLLNRLISVTWTGGSTPVSENLTYDLAGNPTGITRENGSYTVAYDAIDQLTSSTGAYSHAITYDLLGNRAHSSVNGSGSFVNNFLVTNGQSSFLADPDGFGDTIRETSGSVVKNYFYRADDRMNSFQGGSTQAAYYFDALGRRVAKVIDTGTGPFTHSFVHLGAEDRVLMAKSGDGTITTYIDGQGVDEHLAEVKNGVGKGYVTDHLGSVLNGEAAGTSHSFGLFGESASITPSPSSSPVMYGFASREFDAESNLIYNRARMYNPTAGKWLSQDPIGLNGGLNLYSYAGNNPVLYTDPDGTGPVSGLACGVLASMLTSENLNSNGVAAVIQELQQVNSEVDSVSDRLDALTSRISNEQTLSNLTGQCNPKIDELRKKQIALSQQLQALKSRQNVLSSNFYQTVGVPIAALVTCKIASALLPF